MLYNMLSRPLYKTEKSASISKITGAKEKTRSENYGQRPTRYK